jgi:hypothetical protein
MRFMADVRAEDPGFAIWRLVVHEGAGGPFTGAGADRTRARSRRTPPVARPRWLPSLPATLPKPASRLAPAPPQRSRVRGGLFEHHGEGGCKEHELEIAPHQFVAAPQGRQRPEELASDHRPRTTTSGSSASCRASPAGSPPRSAARWPRGRRRRLSVRRAPRGAGFLAPWATRWAPGCGGPPRSAAPLKPRRSRRRATRSRTPRRLRGRI